MEGLWKVLKSMVTVWANAESVAGFFAVEAKWSTVDDAPQVRLMNECSTDAADASALEILERIGANGDDSDLDLPDSEDSPDGAEANEQCDGILDEEEQDCHYDSDTDVDDGDDGVSNPVMPSRERWPRKQVYASVLPDLPELPSSRADERDGWYANQYYARYMDDQALELLHEMTEVSYLQRTGWSLNSSPGKMKKFLFGQPEKVCF
ncbi:hypothetical protein HPB51_006060 [Rhipicephalus microplus]|uniref:Uncharacterized protein n=1 Tax=Rhipicephalus microplus TaxID=6941 RepID=A0A9J6DZI6_RHIMP|nr:hypothetical protein HPB51_006060 [Rhipicephalus microplus]